MADLHPGPQLRAIREHVGMTQVDAAVRLGISQASLSELESGESQVRVHRLVDFCRLYGVEFILDHTGVTFTRDGQPIRFAEQSRRLTVVR